LKAANQVDEQIGRTVANQGTECDVRTVSTASSDGVIYKSPVTSSKEKCQQVLRAQAKLPLWIYCTRYTDRPPGEQYSSSCCVFVIFYTEGEIWGSSFPLGVIFFSEQKL